MNLASLCIELHVLPRPGGLLDQDSLHVYAIQSVLQARFEREKLEEARAKANRK